MLALFKNFFRLSWSLHANTASTFQLLKLTETNRRNIFVGYNLPSILFCSLVFFISGLLYNNYSVSYNFLDAFVHGASLVVAYGVCSFAMLKLFEHWDVAIDECIIYKHVSCSFATLYSISIIVSIIPALFFLNILVVYTVFIVWEGNRVLYATTEEQNTKILVVLSAGVLFVAPLVRIAISFLLPSVWRVKGLSACWKTFILHW